jgi:two-component system, response regulator PdtaR
LTHLETADNAAFKESIWSTCFVSDPNAALALKERFGIPSIFVTATLPNRPEVRWAGIGHLCKPYSEEEIVAAIQAVEAALRGKPRQSLPLRMHLFA